MHDKGDVRWTRCLTLAIEVDLNAVAFEEASNVYAVFG